MCRLFRGFSIHERRVSGLGRHLVDAFQDIVDFWAFVGGLGIPTVSAVLGSLQGCSILL